MKILIQDSVRNVVPEDGQMGAVYKLLPSKNLMELMKIIIEFTQCINQRIEIELFRAEVTRFDEQKKEILEAEFQIILDPYKSDQKKKFKIHVYWHKEDRKFFVGGDADHIGCRYIPLKNDTPDGIARMLVEILCVDFVAKEQREFATKKAEFENLKEKLQSICK